MSDIFSSIPPFTDVADCAIPSPLPSGNFINGIDCPPSGCSSSQVPNPDLPYTFLNCYIVGLTGKLGIGGEESSVTVELIDPNPKSCDYISASICPQSDILSGYSGALGGVYTVQIGGFSFRGILTNHDYQEGSDGFKYSVTLSDGKQILSNVSVIVNGNYSNTTSLQPNLINAVAIKNASVAQNIECMISDPNYSGDGLVCENFGKAGVNQKGMYAFEAIRAIHGQKCKIPVSGLCLTIDVGHLLYLINIYEFNLEARLSSEFMSALEIIDYACNESGYAFLTQIINDTIVVIPISQKAEDLPAGDDRPLFTFMNQFDANTVINRDYGEQMTFNKSQKLILGQPMRYMLSIDHANFLCGDGNSYINAEPVVGDGCGAALLPGSYSFIRINHNYFSGGATIIPDTNGCEVAIPVDGGIIA